MAQQNKTKLKTYFQTGDVPSSNQYGELIDSSLNLTDTSIQIGECSISSSGNIKFQGSSSFVGAITASGNISASGTITAGTASFGNFFPMNQSVTTTSSPTFAGVTFSKTDLSGIEFGASANTSGKSFSVLLQNIPTIAAFSNGRLSATNDEVQINNSTIANDSVIVSSCTTEKLQLFIYRIKAGSFNIKIANLSIEQYESGDATFNFVVF